MSKGACPNCNEYRWSYDGYCLGKCSGNIFDADWPLTKPKDSSNTAFVEKRIRKPRGKSLIEANKYYKHIGKKPPWEEQ